MSEQKPWGLIGYGNVGMELARQVADPVVAERVGLSQFPSFVVRKTGVMEADGITKMDTDFFADLDLPPVTFLTIPSTDTGIEAMNYIVPILDSSQTVITAEKGALANYFHELRDRSDDFDRLGFNAAVGGGTRLRNIANEYCRDPKNVRQIHASLNGTLTAIFSSIAPRGGTGMSLGQAVHQAVSLGYAEPGATSPYEVIRSEAEGDIPKKAAILFNALGLSETPLDWDSLKFHLSDEEIGAAIDEAKVRRFIVSIYPESFAETHHTQLDGKKIGGFSEVHDGWHIVAGFQHTDLNPLFSPLETLGGPGNGIVIGLGPNETDGIYALTGPGAGIRPTANTMLDNYLELRDARMKKPRRSNFDRSLYNSPPLPENLKHLVIDLDVVDTDPALTKDGHMALRLHRLGLQCVTGGLQMHGPNVDPIPKLLGTRDFRDATAKLKRAGTPTFLGPSATLNGSKLTVHSSDSKSTSLGFWVPRDGEEVDLATIPYIRIV